MKLIRCWKCGNVIDGRSAFCQNCGTKISKPAGCGKVGCIIILVLAGLFFMLCAITAILSPNDNIKRRESAEDHTKKENRSESINGKPQTNTAAKTQDHSDNDVDSKIKDGAVAFVHDFLANECFPSTITDEKFEIKFYDNVKAEYLKNIAREGINEKLLEFAREKGKTEMNNWIVVIQKFSLSLSPDTEMNCIAIVELIESGTYKMKSMSINGNRIFP